MTVGIVGAGQLGRMLALAGYPLGLDFLFLDRHADVPAAPLAPTLVGEFTDRALLRTLGPALRSHKFRLGEYFRAGAALGDPWPADPHRTAPASAGNGSGSTRGEAAV